MTTESQATGRLDLALPVGPQLVRLIRKAIVTNVLEPGARISESEIGARYGVSRQPVREAFIKLAEEGLLEVRPQRGTFVRKINVGAVLDARFVREAVEADIARACAAAPHEGLVATLRAQIEAQRQLGSRNAAEFVELDDLFHRTLAEGAGCPNAWAVIDGMKSQLDRVRQLATSHLPVDLVVAQHSAVVDAIEAERPAAAEAAMRAHLSRLLADLPAIQAACPQFFEPQTHQT